MPVRVTLSRAKGWKMPANTVKVDRTTIWGNPYIAGKTPGIEDAEHAVECFGNMLKYGNPEDYPMDDEIKTELRGKNLACWCKPGEPCHADVLLELANKPIASAPEDQPQE